jgi:O-antigen ligase
MFWGLCLVGALGLTAIIDQAFIDRMATIEGATSQNADSSAQSRLVVAEAQLRMFLDHPMGIGWRGTAALSPQYLDEKWLTHAADGSVARSSHNTFLTALVEQGIVGAIIYGALLLWVAAAVFRSRRFSRSDRDPELGTLTAALIASVVAVLVAGTTADFLLAEVQFWMFALILSGFWLGSIGETAGVRVDRANSLGLRSVHARRTP